MADLDAPLAHVRGVTGCSHYHQPPRSQPGGPQLREGFERVELVTGGRGWIEADGRLVEVDAGALLWHLPGDRMICRSDEADPYSCLAVSWAVAPQRPRQVPRITRWDDRAAVLAYTGEVVAAFSDDRCDRRLLAIATYANLLWRARTHLVTAADPALPAPLRGLLVALGREPGRDWSVTAMARLAGWSPSRLHAAFRDRLRTSPHQHLLELRLRRARELLATTGDDLESIARASGLGSAAALCRHFRAAMGMTPREYQDGLHRT